MVVLYYHSIYGVLAVVKCDWNANMIGHKVQYIITSKPSVDQFSIPRFSDTNSVCRIRMVGFFDLFYGFYKPEGKRI
jgi:hypothetical protein